MTLEEALGAGRQPPPALAPLLVAGLRRLLARGSGLEAYLSRYAPPPPPVDLAGLAAYRPAPRTAASTPPFEPGPDFFRPPADGSLDPAERALGRAASEANGPIDSLATLVELMSSEDDVDRLRMLVERTVDRYELGLRIRNAEVAAVALGALHSERLRRAGQGRFLEVLDQGLLRCGEPEVMRSYAALLSDTLIGSEESRRAADLLQGLRENAVIALIDLLSSEPLQSTRRKLLDALASVGRMHLDLIASYESHPQWYVVRNIIWILGRLGPQAVAPIRRVSAHREPRVRREAVRALAQIGSAEAVKGLLGYLHDRDDSVVREAVSKLAALKAAEAVPALHALLQAPGFLEREPETQAAVARALGSLGGEESAALLERLAWSRTLRSPESRSALGEAVAAIRARVAGEGGGS
jgi:HEAT repeat protein